MKRIIASVFACIVLTVGLRPTLAGMFPPPFDSGELADLRNTKIASHEPYALLVVGERVIDLSDHFLPVPGTDRSRLTVDLNRYGIGQTVTALVDPDPFITFGATTTNLVAGPVAYSFLFGTPVVSTQYTNATSSGGVTLTNGASGTAIVSAPGTYPTFISGYGSLGAPTTNLNVDLGTGSLVASGAPGSVTVTRNLGNNASSFAPTTYDNLEALLTYNQTDASSIASWSGSVTLDVPEPAVGCAMLIVVATVARRRR